VSLRAQALDALGDVYDPELDEPITTLGFVGSCTVSEAGDVEVRLRLPTPQCAPNFAFLMAADARTAVRALPEAGAVRVVLEDHYTGEEINAALARGEGFGDAFPGETEGELDALRDLFRRKALAGRQARVCDALLGAGLDHAAVCALSVADLPASEDARRSVALRRALGLPAGAGDPALVAGDGDPIAPDRLALWLRKARLMSLSLESNAGICRSLLAVRYPDDHPKEVAA
jgi:metal-sulfur cluster biosynthetic enzyme